MEWAKKWRKRTTTFIVVHFQDIPSGPPTSWVPPRISHSPTPPSSIKNTTHIPVERGGASVGCPCFWGELWRLTLSPHPSREGRGSLTGGWMWLREKWVARVKVVVEGWVKDEQNSAVMGLIFDWNSAPPHRLRSIQPLSSPIIKLKIGLF